MRVIPLKASLGISGFPSPAQDYEQNSLNLDSLLIEHPSSTFIGLAEGDSMQLYGIFDGDLLIVDRSEEPTEQSSVIVCNFNGEFTCKVLDKKNRCLISGNPKYRPVFISESDVFTIEGVVINSIRMLKPRALLGF
ncbi:LexA family protein [Vibrio harveyi]|uniref:LexA family protein n=1 Tax=Vibrio harveyi TaxID=669 RepID=UPI0002C492C9|nr:translesion error-prone DNA polymerase V autoproteolytic subunit [Vibrio harveyi]EMR36931.1 DNA polymerase V subunit [Vibrio harveyi CAIM 1792]